MEQRAFTKRDFERVVTVLADNVAHHEAFIKAYPDAPKRVLKSAESRRAHTRDILCGILGDDPDPEIQARRDALEKDRNAPWRKRLEQIHPKVWRYKLVDRVLVDFEGKA